MVNSIILASLFAFFSKIWDWFKISIIGKAFFVVCNAVSQWWKDSLIVTALRKDEREYTEKSL